MYPYNLNEEEILKKTLNFEIKEASENENSEENHSLDEYIIELIKEGILDKSISLKYYDTLSKITENFEEEKLLRKVYLDELKHLKMLKEIYYILTETDFEYSSKDPEFEDSLLESYEKSIFSKLENVDFYRRLLFSFLNIQIRDWFYEIITDEQSNSQIFQYLYINLLEKK